MQGWQVDFTNGRGLVSTKQKSEKAIIALQSAVRQSGTGLVFFSKETPRLGNLEKKMEVEIALVVH